MIRGHIHLYQVVFIALYNAFTSFHIGMRKDGFAVSMRKYHRVAFFTIEKWHENTCRVRGILF